MDYYSTVYLEVSPNIMHYLDMYSKCSDCFFKLTFKIGPVRLLELALPVLDSEGDRDRFDLPWKDAID